MADWGMVHACVCVPAENGSNNELQQLGGSDVSSQMVDPA